MELQLSATLQSSQADGALSPTRPGQDEPSQGLPSTDTVGRACQTAVSGASFSVYRGCVDGNKDGRQGPAQLRLRSSCIQANAEYIEEILSEKLCERVSALAHAKTGEERPQGRFYARSPSRPNSGTLNVALGTSQGAPTNRPGYGRRKVLPDPVWHPVWSKT
ncbi:hypothetical protein BCV70DRAFT_196991 [Testicularia cyperi]|uniref:Uncharacterized protein n=1 Tax=Testicularia cyperi TaxID=1882483 RepID=A0A317XXU4_9BASI|nr:hypothetical protein BCV70DRAFT_196991 [Testicularia cyperi]